MAAIYDDDGNYIGDDGSDDQTAYAYDNSDYTDYGIGGTDAFDWSWSGDYAGSNLPVEEIPNAAALPGEPGYGWKYYTDGTAVSPDGKYYYNGELVSDPTGGGLLGALPKGIAAGLKKAFTDKDGNIDMRAVAGAAGGLYGLYKGLKGETAAKVGYQGGIPSYTAVRE